MASVTDRIASYYDQLAARFGNSPRAVDAPNQHALDVRYRVLGDVTDMNGKSVLEVGCGHGGLGAYLTSRYPGIRYTGIDVSAGLLELGAQAHPDLDIYRADLADIYASADVVVAQGIFYLRRGYDDVKQLLRQMFALAGEAVAVTAISRWMRDGYRSSEFRVDPPTLLEICHRDITPNVVLRHDYHPGDVAVYLYRKGNA